MVQPANYRGPFFDLTSITFVNKLNCMNNRLSFMNSFFVLLLVGKIGHIGTLAGLSWAWIFLPLLLDLLLDFITKMGYINAWIFRLRDRMTARKMQRIVDRQNGNGNG